MRSFSHSLDYPTEKKLGLDTLKSSCSKPFFFAPKTNQSAFTSTLSANRHKRKVGDENENANRVLKWQISHSRAVFVELSELRIKD
jgi:hypothetical protein